MELIFCLLVMLAGAAAMGRQLRRESDRMPHVFDFLRPKPLKGYDR